MTCFHFGSDSARGLEHADRSTDVISGAWAPPVTMPANDHHLIRVVRAANDAAYVGDRLHRISAPIVAYDDSRLHRARSDVVVESEATLPCRRHVLASCVPKQLSCVPVTDWDNRNSRNAPRRLGDSRRTRDTAIAGRRWIAIGIVDTSALYAGGGSHRPFRKYVTNHEPVVLGVAVNDQTDGAVFLGFARLDAPKRSTVARNGDLALNADTD